MTVTKEYLESRLGFGIESFKVVTTATMPQYVHVTVDVVPTVAVKEVYLHGSLYVVQINNTP